MADEKVAEFSATGGPLEVEISIGQIKVATTDLFIFGQTGKRIQHNAGNEIDDTFPVSQPLSVLDDSVVRWTVVINAPNNKPNQKWAVVTSIKQGGKPIKGGVISNSGTFQTVTVMTDKVRLTAK